MSVAEFRAGAAAWLAEHRSDAPPDYGAITPPDLVDHAVRWHRELHGAGYAAIHWPVEFGGQGLTREHTSAWQGACATAGVPAAFNMVGLVLTAEALLRHGTAVQRAEHLPPTACADRLWCQLFSEPSAGSDLASLSTRAERDGDRYLVNGQKVWCSGGRYSDWGILLARTDPAAPPHQGISCFMVDMRSPGIEVRPLRQMTGDAEFDDVFITDVEVPADHLIGPEHGGWQVAMAVLGDERGHIGAAAAGLERRLAALVPDGAERIDDPIRRDRVATLLCRGRSLTSLAARAGGGDESHPGLAGSLLKLGITELSFDLAMEAGTGAGMASVVEGGRASAMLAAPGGRIAGGTSQVQRNIIGERILGLPRAPR
ncbi:MAG: acyl-CoA dehydrogenase family protein [Ilumatobacteraceae bacterium]